LCPAPARNILIASKLDEAAIATLREQHNVTLAFGASEQELCEKIRNCHILVFRSGVQITARVLQSAPDLSLLIRAGSGLDNLDLACAESLGLKLIRVPEPGARAVAELSFGLMLMLARQMRPADRLLREGHWAKSEITGYLLQGKRLGIIGAGNIGALVGQMGHAWGMEVIGCVENPCEEALTNLEAHNIQPVPMSDVLSTADFVSLHVPLQSSTRGMIDATALGTMKPGAFLINLARGGVVDEAALYQELTTPGRLAGAGLDVHAAEGEGKISQLAELDNVVLTPHIGASTIDTQRQIGERVLEIVRDDLATATLPPHTRQPDVLASAGPNQ
jgi:phosphoglycerate dehydrogenase-like enzyme